MSNSLLTIPVNAGTTNIAYHSFFHIYAELPSLIVVDEDIHIQPVRWLQSLNIDFEILRVLPNEAEIYQFANDDDDDYTKIPVPYNAQLNDYWNYLDKHPESPTYPSEDKYQADIIISLIGYSIVIYFGGSVVQFAYKVNDHDKVIDLINGLSGYIWERPRNKEEPVASINIVTQDERGAYSSILETIPKPPLSNALLEASYSIAVAGKEEIDGLTAMDKLVSMLGEQEEVAGTETYPNNGLYILHGEPGTGKTSFITELLLRLDLQTYRNVYYFPANCAQMLGDPGFQTWLSSRKGAILVFEDAEAILRSNELRTAATANILNLTSGIPGAILQVAVVCTFNCGIDQLDGALLRKGRLRYQAEFKALSNVSASNFMLVHSEGSGSSSMSSHNLTQSSYTLADLYDIVESSQEADNV